jgi:hypothetical protein
MRTLSAGAPVRAVIDRWRGHCRLTLGLLRRVGPAQTLPCGAAVLAALISIVVGVDTLSRPPRLNPYWPKVQALSPLDDAPIASGTRGILVLPGVGRDECRVWLFEARWRRPDLLLSLSDEWPQSEKPAVVVAIGRPDLLPGWHLVWRGGEVYVAKPDGPR